MILLKSIQSQIDDTIKCQLLTRDNHIIEACIIFFHDEKASVNICISSQVGCMCNCSFCATGPKRFVRNLSKDEIIEQVEIVFATIPQIYNKCFEITYMGTGDPLNNLESVLDSIDYFDQIYKNLDRINISTVMPHLNFKKEDFIKQKHPIHFQYSLHFLTDELRKKYFRTKLVSINSSLTLLNDISTHSNEEFCINYLLFKNVNDSSEDAKKLIELARNLKAYIKISKYCPIPNGILEPTDKFDLFASILEKENIKWKPFESKGKDIRASCGHLLSDIDF